MKKNIKNGIEEFSLSRYLNSTELTFDDLKKLDEVIKKDIQGNLGILRFSIKICSENNTIEFLEIEEINKHENVKLENITDLSFSFSNRNYSDSKEEWITIQVRFNCKYSFSNEITVNGNNESLVRGKLEQIYNFIESKKSGYWLLNETGNSAIKHCFQGALVALIFIVYGFTSLVFLILNNLFAYNLSILIFWLIIWGYTSFRKRIFPFLKLTKEKNENRLLSFLKNKELHEKIISAIVGGIITKLIFK